MKQEKNSTEGSFKHYKRGWNWEFVFEPTTGGRQVVVTERLLWHHQTGTDVVISAYPFGEGRREDSVVEAIHETLRDLYTRAAEEAVRVIETRDRYFDQLIIEAPITSGFVQDFVYALSRIRRVMVVTRAIAHDSRQREANPQIQNTRWS